MTCWICSSVAPSCMTMTMVNPQFLKFFGRQKAPAPQNPPGCKKRASEGGRYTIWNSFGLLAACGGRLAVHGAAFGGAGFVDDAFEEAANGGVREGAAIIGFGVGKDLFFARRLVQG